MPFVTRPLLLQALATHGPLTAFNLAKEEVLGFVPDSFQVKFLLHQLLMDGKIAEIENTADVAYALAEAVPPAELAKPVTYGA